MHWMVLALSFLFLVVFFVQVVLPYPEKTNKQNLTKTENESV